MPDDVSSRIRGHSFVGTDEPHRFPGVANDGTAEEEVDQARLLGVFSDSRLSPRALGHPSKRRVMVGDRIMARRPGRSWH